MIFIKNSSFIFFLLMFVLNCQSQIKNTQINPDLLQEKVHFFCDRDSYLSGDYISFYISYEDLSGLEDKQLSDIVYLELITYSGVSFVKKKFLIKKGKVSGSIKIPDDLISGFYYIKVYTRWMRNYTPQIYSYTPVKIINYKSNEFIKPPGSDDISEFRIDTVNIKSANNLIKLSKKTTERGNNVNIEINTGNIKPDALIMRIVPYSLYQNYKLNVVCTNKQESFDFNYLPETRGVSLSGIVVDKENKQAIENNMVNVSVFDTVNYSLTTTTDSAGKFYFDLGKTCGEKELLITADEKTIPLEILVDNDFCNQKVLLPFIPFSINDKSRKFYTNFINRGIVENKYITTYNQNTESTGNYINLNYQSPDFKIVLSDYIALPHLADYFYELFPNVGIRRIDNQSVFQIFGYYSEKNRPIVLVDNVIITNIDNLLQISAKNIKSIETFEKPYAIGDKIFSGIIRINSKQRDLAKIELPESGLFINYKMLSYNTIVNYNKKNTPAPLLGNTVFWRVWDDSEMNKNTQKVTVNVGDLPGKYTIEVMLVKDNSYTIDTLSYFVK